MSRRWLLLPLLALTIALATSCGQKAQDTTSTTEPATSTPASTINVTAIELGRGVGSDKRITERVDTFNPSDVIYASVITSGAAPTATLKARWTFQDGQVVDESEQMIAPTGDSVTEFHISKPDGWPAGKYKIEVFLDGSPVQTREFEVKAA